jgi:hypothetical protein
MSQIAGIYPTIANTGDPYFGNVVLLMHMDASGPSGIYTDSSPIAAAMDAANNTAGTVASRATGPTPKFGDTYATFGTTSSGILVPANAGFAWAQGVDFTVECWVYVTTAPSAQICGQWANSASTAPRNRWQLHLQAGKPAWSIAPTDGAGTAITLSSSTALTTGAWNHVAVSRSGASTRIFLNGTQTGINTTTQNIAVTFDQTVRLGVGRVITQTAGGLGTTGLIDDFRITSGVARYTTAFTPPTVAFPNA